MVESRENMHLSSYIGKIEEKDSMNDHKFVFGVFLQGRFK